MGEVKEACHKCRRYNPKARDNYKCYTRQCPAWKPPRQHRTDLKGCRRCLRCGKRLYKCKPSDCPMCKPPRQRRTSWEEKRTEYETRYEMTEGRHGRYSFNTFCMVMHALEEAGFEITTDRTYFPDLDYKVPK